MADISSIKIPSGTTYTVKDSTARNHIGNKNNPHGVTAAQTGALPLTGGTMTGQIKTSFKDSVAIGSYGATSTTLEDVINELRFSSGCMGSVSLAKDYGIVVAGWYNYIYIPHRTGGLNGNANGDNANYGAMILIGMTSPSEGHAYVLTHYNGSVGNIFTIINNTSVTDNYVTEIKLNNWPGYVSVKYGGALDVSRFTAIATYSDGTTKQIPNSELTFSIPANEGTLSAVHGHKTSNSSENETYLTISYTENGVTVTQSDRRVVVIL